MNNNLNIKTVKKTWNEYFSYDNKNLSTKLINFWSWNASDLLNNAMRWKFAEYIIALSLWIDDGYRIERDEYDLVYEKVRIEIKSGAYLQSWEQDTYSKIILWIKPTNSGNGVLKRQSDVYIFAILSCKDAEVINPLRLEQRDFYILKTSILNKELWNQKTIGLNSLLKLNPIKSNFWELRKNLDLLFKLEEKQ